MVSSEGACAAYYRYRRQCASEAGMTDERHGHGSLRACPRRPATGDERVLLAHGGGGRAMRS